MADADKVPEKTDTSQFIDEDLDGLLDSALDDFDKPLPKVTAPPSSSGTKQTEENIQTEGNEWGNEFAQFQDMMAQMLKTVPGADGSNVSDESSGAAGLSAGDFTASLADTLKTISDSAQSLNEPSSEELAQLLKCMGMEEGNSAKNDQVPDLMPFMENMMQSLLSKELLYPSLKDIVNKYPDYLAENQPSLDEELFQKYTMQYELMKQVCEEFENQDSSSEGDKSNSFPKILALMQKMQECGNPPKELLGEMPADLPFDDQGNMKIPGMPEQCTIM